MRYLLLILCLVACSETIPPVGDTDEDTDTTTDTEEDTETDTTEDTDSGIDTDTAIPCEGWLDEDSGLCWQLDRSDEVMMRPEAKIYCESLGDGWHTPTVDEYKTLVDSMDLDGNCGDTDYIPCEEAGVVCPDGCYWREEMTNGCDELIEKYHTTGGCVDGAFIYYIPMYGTLFKHSVGDSIGYVKCVK